jgi:hypothetical protein
MLFGKVACLGIAHLFHFLCCSGATALNGLKLIKSLLCLDRGNITKKAFDDSLDWRGGAVRISKPGLLGEWMSDFVITTAHGIPEASIDLLSETVLFITRSCVVLDSKSVKLLEVLIILLILGLLMRGPVGQKLSNTFFVGLRCIAEGVSIGWQLPNRGLGLAHIVLDDQEVLSLVLH